MLCSNCEPVSPWARAAANDNTSGSALASVPPEVQQMGFCWGAFVLRFFWSSAMNYPMGGAPWLLGKHGHAIAWQYRRFASLEQFRATMDAWDKAGWGVGVTVLGALLVAMIWNMVKTGQ